MKPLLSIASILALSVASSLAESTFTGGGGDPSWSNSANWDPEGVPDSEADIIVGAIPSGDTILLDTGFPEGGIVTDMASLTFASTLTGSTLTIAPALDESISVGNITNASTVAVEFTTYVYSRSNSTWEGNIGFNFANLQTSIVEISGASTSIVFVSGSTLTFEVGNSATEYGRFVNSNASSVNGLILNDVMITLSLQGIYTLVAGDTFTLASGFTLSSYNFNLPDLAEGLSWDTTAFANGGLLTVVPEPSTYALIALAAIGLVALRCRSRSC